MNASIKKIASLLVILPLMFIVSACDETSSEQDEAHLMEGTFDIETAESFYVNDLECYAPENWDLVDFDEEDSEECRGAKLCTEESGDDAVADYYVDYYGDYEDFDEGIDAICEEWGFDKDNFSKITLDGCDEAYEYDYTTEDGWAGYAVAVNCCGSTFSFVGCANSEYFDRGTFKKMIRSTDFQDYTGNIQLYPGSDIPDFGALTGAENNPGKADALIPLITGGDNQGFYSYVYYLDDDAEDTIDTYIYDLLRDSFGFDVSCEISEGGSYTYTVDSNNNKAFGFLSKTDGEDAEGDYLFIFIYK